ncbi:MAG: hypothetical protein OEY11_12850 [Gammaproteobacteria bacterium]|nr:hypothetical protein [Gammaproteobacteria bacterium]
MKFKLVTSLILLFFIQTANAQSWKDFGAVFQVFLEKLDTVKVSSGKEYSVDQLSKLHRDLYALEKDQQYLVIMMETPGMIDNNLQVSLEGLRSKSNAVRTKIKRIGRKLSALSKQSSKLQKMLYRLTYSKKFWPSKMRKVDMPDYHLQHFILTEGRNAYQVTHNARKDLEEFLKTH